MTRVASAGLAWMCAIAIGGGCTSDPNDERARSADEAQAVTFEVAPDALQRSLTYAVEDLDISGAVVAIADGEDRWVAVEGHSDPKATLAVEPDTQFAIASITKTFTTTVALLLAEDGIVDLDEPVPLPGVAPATLRDLLGHTAGLVYEARHDDAPWREAEIAGLATASRVCDPGTCFNYSDLGFVAAGLVLEETTGESIRALYERLLFTPLGLDRTELVDRDHVPDGIATSDQPGGWPPAPAVPVNTWTAGAIVTTATDLARFGRALLSGEILNDDSLAAMLDTRSRELPCVDGCEPYGLGITRIRVGGHPGWGHGGSSGAELVHFDDGPTIAVLSTKPGSGRAVVARVAEEAIPALSPRSDIYEIDAEGASDAVRLTDDRATDAGPSWSPDGTEVVFTSTRQQAHAQLYILDTTTGATRRLTRGDAVDDNPVWSPVDDRIAFVRDDTVTRDIFTIRSDGTDLRRVTDHGTHSVWNPAWSPDATQIAYEIAEPSSPNSDVAIIRPDGTGHGVIHRDGSEWWVTWSPDGSQLAFWQGGEGIHVMNPDGTGSHPISGQFSGDIAPAWGPGGRIAFANRGDIWTMNADGTDRRQITDTEAIESQPQWTPDGARLAYESDQT